MRFPLVGPLSYSITWGEIRIPVMPPQGAILHLIKVMLGLGKLQCGGAIGKYSGASHSLNHTIYLSNDADDSEADYAPIREG